LYACLSHCWGRKPVLETTPESIDEFQRSIPWNAIPATFRDAIEFTRALGLQYLWIDSLCIIQHDTSVPSDWQRESSRMASIYENSYITLAAATSQDSTIGCFDGKDWSEFEPYRLTAIPKLDARGCSIYARRSLPHTLERVHYTYFPLLSRAWVFQERLLSRRMLYLGKGELQWECKQTHKCECGAASDDSRDDQPVRNSKVCFTEGIDLTKPALDRSTPDPNHASTCEYCSPSQKRDTGSTGVRSVNQLYTQHFEPGGTEYVSPPYPEYLVWRELLRTYASLQMTFDSDIFPALSGLAHSWHNQHGSRYLAGLWERHLFHDLLWLNGQCRNRPVKWRAPTWSWASLEDCEYGHRNLDSFAHQKQFVTEGTRVESVDIALDGPDWAGQLRHARIAITCRAITGRIHYWPITYEGSPAFFQSDRRPYRLISHGVIYQAPAILLDCFIWEPESPAFQESGAIVYLLPLVVITFDSSPTITESEETAPIDDQPVECLILLCKGDSKEALVYERIGLARLSPGRIHNESLVAVENWIPDGDPKEWPQVEPPTEEERKQELGLARVEPWMYDAHCKITRAIREAPLCTFTIV
jgi:hypothetical protein